MTCLLAYIESLEGKIAEMEQRDRDHAMAKPVGVSGSAAL
jgi:hypothetical protein